MLKNTLKRPGTYTKNQQTKKVRRWGGKKSVFLHLRSNVLPCLHGRYVLHQATFSNHWNKEPIGARMGRGKSDCLPPSQE